MIEFEHIAVDGCSHSPLKLRAAVACASWGADELLVLSKSGMPDPEMSALALGLGMASDRLREPSRTLGPILVYTDQVSLTEHPAPERLRRILHRMTRHPSSGDMDAVVTKALLDAVPHLVSGAILIARQQAHTGSGPEPTLMERADRLAFALARKTLDANQPIPERAPTRSSTKKALREQLARQQKGQQAFPQSAEPRKAEQESQTASPSTGAAAQSPPRDPAGIQMVGQAALENAHILIGISWYGGHWAMIPRLGTRVSTRHSHRSARIKTETGAYDQALASAVLAWSRLVNEGLGYRAAIIAFTDAPLRAPGQAWQAIQPKAWTALRDHGMVLPLIQVRADQAQRLGLEDLRAAVIEELEKPQEAFP